MLTLTEGFVQIAEPSASLPYLSHSRVSRYLFCPEQYRLYYVENLRPALPSASLEFGRVIHAALAKLFMDGLSPAEAFAERWEGMREVELRYAFRESWETLMERGKQLLDIFVEQELPKLHNVSACEQSFNLTVGGLDVPFVGVIDLVAEIDDKETVIDFKTAGAAYQDHEVDLSDQLTAYQLAKPQAQQSALCVLVKTKEPRIDWYYSQRTGEQLAEYLQKVGIIRQAISSGLFYKRPGKWCGQCDFLPLCLETGSKAKASSNCWPFFWPCE